MIVDDVDGKYVKDAARLLFKTFSQNPPGLTTMPETNESQGQELSLDFHKFEATLNWELRYGGLYYFVKNFGSLAYWLLRSLCAEELTDVYANIKIRATEINWLL
jgi:hypothetical protein